MQGSAQVPNEPDQVRDQALVPQTDAPWRCTVPLAYGLPDFPILERQDEELQGRIKEEPGNADQLECARAQKRARLDRGAGVKETGAQRLLEH